MFQIIATILAWFYEVTGNYALAIGLLTLTVMVLLLPLTLKGTRSMIQMQRLQPEIKKLQTEFKGDRQRLNEEMMKFYQENKINPVGGCLPLLIQAPVFMVLYRVINKLTETCSPEQITSAASKVGNRCNAPQIAADTFGPSYVERSTQLWKDLAGAKQMLSFGIDLSHSTVTQIGLSFVQAIPFMILILLVGVTSWYQQRQIMARTKGQPSPIPAQQQMIMKFLPFMWPIFLLIAPTGLAVYALVSNLFRIGQQALITRTMYHRHEDGTFRPAVGSSPIITRSTEVIEAPKVPPVPPKAKNRPNPRTTPPKSAPVARSGPAPKVTPPAKESTDHKGRGALGKSRPTPKAKPKPKPGASRPEPRDKRQS
jgi:YidC/Oxa1 family membrane protein insertase